MYRLLALVVAFLLVLAPITIIAAEKGKGAKKGDKKGDKKNKDKKKDKKNEEGKETPPGPVPNTTAPTDGAPPVVGDTPPATSDAKGASVEDMLKKLNLSAKQMADAKKVVKDNEGKPMSEWEPKLLEIFNDEQKAKWETVKKDATGSAAPNVPSDPTPSGNADNSDDNEKKKGEKKGEKKAPEKKKK